jgi:hypothetical protein
MWASDGRGHLIVDALWGSVGGVILGCIAWAISGSVVRERAGAGGRTYRLALFFGGLSVLGALFGYLLMGPWVLPLAAIGLALCVFFLIVTAVVHRGEHW